MERLNKENLTREKQIQQLEEENMMILQQLDKERKQLGALGPQMTEEEEEKEYQQLVDQLKNRKPGIGDNVFNRRRGCYSHF